MIKKYTVSFIFAIVTLMSFGSIFMPQIASAASCDAAQSNRILGFPRWYEYLPKETVTDGLTGNPTCQPKLESIIDIWKVVAAVIEILLRISSLVAIGFVVYGGITYITSQGAPDKTKQALQTIINALVGLVIAIVAATVIGFIAGRFNGTGGPSASTMNTPPPATSSNNGPRLTV